MPSLLASLIVFMTSAGVLVLEILAGRLLAPYVGVTLETYTGIIGTVLAGIALGSWWGGRLADTRDARTLLGPTIAIGGLLALACLPVVRMFGPALAGRDPIAIVTLAFLGFFAPATVLSGVTPMVVKIQLASLRMTGRTVGRLSAIGTVGALFGTFITGFVLLAMFPTPPIVIAVGAMLTAGGIALWTWLPRHERASQPPVIAAAVALAALGLVVGTPCEQETAYFCASVVPDPEASSGRLLVLDTLRHSYVDLDEPTHLEFDYARSVVDVIDAHHDPQQPLDVLHIGGGGFTLPMYLAATRPGTDSLVFELDPQLITLAHEELGLETSPQLQVTAGDARLGIRDLPSDSRDVVIGDAFGGLAVPWHLTTTEFVAEIERVLRPGGIYVLNLIDHPPLAFARAETATLADAFGEAAVIAPPERLAGDEGGNFVLAGGDTLDGARIQQVLDARAATEVVASGPELARFAGDARVLTDAYAPVDQLLEPQAVPD
ncbi:MAG TPA: fused MFS/spermidine synthase [Euzebyales bacterium]|nr:fused MFS/spermidine synthase [Euzebyales bacterium]